MPELARASSLPPIGTVGSETPEMAGLASAVLRNPSTAYDERASYGGRAVDATCRSARTGRAMTGMKPSPPLSEPKHGRLSAEPLRRESSGDVDALPVARIACRIRTPGSIPRTHAVPRMTTDRSSDGGAGRTYRVGSPGHWRTWKVYDRFAASTVGRASDTLHRMWRPPAAIQRSGTAGSHLTSRPSAAVIPRRIAPCIVDVARRLAPSTQVIERPRRDSRQPPPSVGSADMAALAWKSSSKTSTNAGQPFSTSVATRS